MMFEVVVMLSCCLSVRMSEETHMGCLYYPDQFTSSQNIYGGQEATSKEAGFRQIIFFSQSVFRLESLH